METLNYLAYFCKNVLSICMNRLTKVMLFSSDRKNTGLACCFLGRINFDGSFCDSRICDQATRNERYAFLFGRLLLLSNTTTYVHCIISCLSSCVTWRFSLFVSLGGCGFCLPGLSHSGIKEYGQMLNPEVQDQISMCIVLILSSHGTTNSFSIMQFSILVEHISTSLCWSQLFFMLKFLWIPICLCSFSSLLNKQFWIAELILWLFELACHL